MVSRRARLVWLIDFEGLLVRVGIGPSTEPAAVSGNTLRFVPVFGLWEDSETRAGVGADRKSTRVARMDLLFS